MGVSKHYALPCKMAPSWKHMQMLNTARTPASVKDKTLLTWCCFVRIQQLYRGIHTLRNTANRQVRVNSTTEENQYKRLADSVTPYHNRLYEHQLQTKDYVLRVSLRKVINIIRRNRPFGQYTPAIRELGEANDGQMCSFSGVKPAPEIFFYRNKDEMSVGRDVHGVSRTVGLYVGRSSQGRVVCVNPGYLINMKKRHKEIIGVYQSFLRQSPRGEYQPGGCTGYWSSIVLRSSQQGETMLTVLYRELQKSQEERLKVKDELRHFFQEGPGQALGLTSIYLRPSLYYRWHNTETHLVLGSPHIYEHVLGRVFRVSSDSFFQTNTPAAEVLYSTIRDYVKLSSARTVIDVCCGTGIIGILLADLVDFVFGVELIEQAVQDAHVNAQMNGVRNAEFICGKAHRALQDVLPNRTILGDAIAVVNPGRVGVNLKVINALRQCRQIRHVIYVSCKPHGNAVVNFIDLIVPENDRVKGDPFLPVEAVGVDMFPQTAHCELIVRFKR